MASPRASWPESAPRQRRADDEVAFERVLERSGRMSRGCGAGQNQAEEDYQAGICRRIAEHHSSSRNRAPERSKIFEIQNL